MNRFQDVWSKVGKSIETLSGNSIQNVSGEYAQGDEEAHGTQDSEIGSHPEPQDDTTVRAASAVSEGLFDHKLTQSEKKIAGPAVHYILGTCVGGLYGAAAERAPKVTAWTGLPFGAAFWLVVDEGAVPLLGLSEGPMAYPLSTHAYALSSHFVFGLTAEVVRRAVRSALQVVHFQFQNSEISDRRLMSFDFSSVSAYHHGHSSTRLITKYRKLVLERAPMKKVTGIGGVFFKSQDPASLKEWYRTHLGIDAGEYGATFSWRETDDSSKEGQTVWSPFPKDTKYFDPSSAPFMINYRVADLDSLLKELRAAGVTVDDRVETYDYGRFGWVMDPEGNRIELWEPGTASPDELPEGS